MNVDITQLLIVFDELLYPFTNEETGIYWFKFRRIDGYCITLILSIYESSVNLTVSDCSSITFSSIKIKNCSAIRVLDEDKKCLEIIHGNNQGRCFLALSNDNIVAYDE